VGGAVTSARAWLQHRLNPLHVRCRLYGAVDWMIDRYERLYRRLPWICPRKH
jgi:hypothetical protein